MENLEIRFYKPSEKFKATPEMVVVGTKTDLFACFGPNGFDNKQEYESWINTIAQAVLFKRSFEMYNLIMHYDVTLNVISKLQKDFENDIDEIVERLLPKFKNKQLLKKQIYEKLEDATRLHG